MKSIFVALLVWNFASVALAQESHPWRAATEELGLLGVEELHYVTHHDLNSRDWDFRYSLGDVPKKFSGKGIGLDTNGFATNFKMHPIAGALYYAAARGNGLEWQTSLIYSFSTSLIWEYLAEWREQASINDIVVTPMAGFLIQEPLHQLGAFFDQGCATLPNTILGAVVAPSETLHRWIDGRELARAQACDQYGFTTLGGHRLESRVLWGSRFFEDQRAATVRVDLGAEIVGLPHYGHVGEGMETWSDASVANTQVSLSWIGSRTSETRADSWVMPWGLHARNLHDHEGALTGDELLFGLLIGGEVESHFWGTQNLSKSRWFSLNLPGAAFRYRILGGGTTLEVGLQASAAFTGQDSLAINSYLASGGSLDQLTSVARGEHYNYGAGFRVKPELRLTTEWLSLGAYLNAARVTGIRALDRDHHFMSDVEVMDARARAEAWLEVGPERWPFRVSLRGGWLRRESQVGPAHVTLHETHLLLGVGVLL